MHTGIQCTASIVTLNSKGFGVRSFAGSSLDEAPVHCGVEEMDWLYCYNASQGSSNWGRHSLSATLQSAEGVTSQEIEFTPLWTVQLRASHTHWGVPWCYGLKINPFQWGKFHLWEWKLVCILCCLDLGLYFLAFDVKSCSWWHCSWLFWFGFRYFVVCGRPFTVLHWRCVGVPVQHM